MCTDLVPNLVPRAFPFSKRKSPGNEVDLVPWTTVIHQNTIFHNLYEVHCESCTSAVLAVQLSPPGFFFGETARNSAGKFKNRGARGTMGRALSQWFPRTFISLLPSSRALYLLSPHSPASAEERGSSILRELGLLFLFPMENNFVLLRNNN